MSRVVRIATHAQGRLATPKLGSPECMVFRQNDGTSMEVGLKNVLHGSYRSQRQNSLSYLNYNQGLVLLMEEILHQLGTPRLL